jgi:hypothetical protein
MFTSTDELRVGSETAYEESERLLTPEQRTIWENATQAESYSDQWHQDGFHLRSGGVNRFTGANPWQFGYFNKFTPTVRLDRRLAEWYQDGIHPGAGTSPHAGDPVPVVPGVWNANLLFQQGAATPYFVFNDYGSPITPGAIVVPVRRVYIVINSATLYRVEGNVFLPTFAMQLSLDTESWTWGFSATLPGDTLSLLQPNGAGDPVEVKATINSVEYRMLIEGVSRSRQFGQSTLTVRGRGLNAILDAPYAPIQNFGNTITRTAQQLMDDVLTINGVSMGWSVDWQMEDWTVPGNIWTHQGSHITALNSIVQASGGYLQPTATGKGVRALHRYPLAPWDWATPDITLPTAVTVQEGVEWVERARYNRVFVSGTRGGVIGQVTRTGSAGDLLAPMVTDALITDAIAARHRGISVLGPTGRQANLTLSLPVLAETGIITPGKLVSYDGKLGITRGVQVNVGRPDITQSILVETYA